MIGDKGIVRRTAGDQKAGEVLCNGYQHTAWYIIRDILKTSIGAYLSITAISQVLALQEHAVTSMKLHGGVRRP